jgi:hypothetical protein
LTISDIVIGGYDWRMMVVVYSALAAPLLLGRYLRGRLGTVRVAASALASSVVFFLTTNLAVWYYGYWYTRDLKSLLQCYAAAVPFFRNTVAGDLLWSFILFTGYAVVKLGRPAILIPDTGSNPPGDR